MQIKFSLTFLIMLAIVNVVVASTFSLPAAIISTAIGLFFSIIWLVVFSKVLKDKYHGGSLEKELSYKDLLYLVSPGFIYYLSVWGVILVVYFYS